MDIRKFLLGVLILSNLSSQVFARGFLFSSESVAEGHPDKLCDQISDAVLDAHLAMDPESRVACETFALNGNIVIGGEITSSAQVEVKEIARNKIREIGYTDPAFGLDCNTCNITTIISKQSADIALGVDTKDMQKEQGAGDQGLMFGYATDETPELMPFPIIMAHKIVRRITELRKNGTLAWARPDGKAQVTVKYIDGIPVEITSVVASVQHSPNVTQEQIQRDLKELVIKPLCKDYLNENTKYYINPTGCFISGGPEADAGLTGRKIIVDTYGGMGRHGGGCFSGKDPSKVDRSAAYMARYIAKNIVAAGLAKRCEVQLAYSIGVAEPVSVYVNTFNTGIIDEVKLEEAVREIFPLKPAEIIKHLDLKRPIYQKTAAGGHFGRDDKDFTWEQTDKVDQLKLFSLNLKNFTQDKIDKT